MNPVYLPLALSHPAFFMAQVNDPTVCPDGLPTNIWEDANKVGRAIKANFDDRESHLEFLATQAGKIVASPVRFMNVFAKQFAERS